MDGASKKSAGKPLPAQDSLVHTIRIPTGNGRFAVGDAVSALPELDSSMHQLFTSNAMHWSPVIRACFDELDRETPRVLEALAHLGWYLGANTPAAAASYLASIIDDGEWTEVERYLAEIHREAFGDILSGVKKMFPRRAEILGDTFQAHLEGKYSLSVPSFLAQADGIAHDLTESFFFYRPLTQKKIAAAVNASPYIFQKAFLQSLTTEGSLRKNGVSVNRHSVLHGRNTSYATERFSLQCVSLLDYLAFVCDIYKEVVVQ